MDFEPERREQNVARWTLTGAIGAVAGPLLLSAFAWARLGWRVVFRWLFLLELSDLLLDVLLAFLALCFVDEVGTSVATGDIAVAVWTGAGLVGSATMIPLLRHIDGLRYLRGSASGTGLLFVAFLLVPNPGAKLASVAAIAVVNAG